MPHHRRAALSPKTYVESMEDYVLKSLQGSVILLDVFLKKKRKLYVLYNSDESLVGVG